MVASHNIHQEQPQLVMDAVEYVIAAAETARTQRKKELAGKKNKLQVIGRRADGGATPDDI